MYASLKLQGECIFHNGKSCQGILLLSASQLLSFMVDERALLHTSLLLKLKTGPSWRCYCIFFADIWL